MRPALASAHSPLVAWITRIAVLGGLALGFAIIMANFLPSIHAQQKAEQELTLLKEQEAQKRLLVDQLRERKVLLETNTEYQETKLRDVHNLKRPSEQIYRFGEKSGQE